MSAKHTPTPWDFEGAEDCCRIVSYIDPKREEIAVRLNQADAAFIVRAVNSHEENVKALKKAHVALKELFRELGEKEVGKWDLINEGCIAVEQAIAKAEARP